MENKRDLCRYCGCIGDLRAMTCYVCATGDPFQKWWHRMMIRFGWTKRNGL